MMKETPLGGAGYTLMYIRREIERNWLDCGQLAAPERQLLVPRLSSAAAPAGSARGGDLINRLVSSRDPCATGGMRP